MSEVKETPDATAPPRAYDEMAAELARVYASAYLNAAEKEGSVDDALAELAEVRAALLQNYPTFALMMSSPVRSAAEKDRSLVAVLGGRVLPVNLKFARVLNRHGRLELLGLILEEAVALWDRRQNRRPVTVRSAVPLSDAQQAAVRDRLAGSLRATPVLKLEVDPALIGGLVVQVGDEVYDASVRNRLEQLRLRLTEGKTHEIQSRRDQFSHPA